MDLFAATLRAGSAPVAGLMLSTSASQVTSPARSGLEVAPALGNGGALGGPLALVRTDAERAHLHDRRRAATSAVDEL